MSTTDTSSVLAHDQDDQLTYCAVHPDRETSLRCNRCGRLMCVECAVQTPVGYRCRECVRGIEDKFYTATSNEYLASAGASGILTAIAATVVGLINLPLLFILILGLPIGGAIGEAALRASQRKRGRQSAVWAALGSVGGGIVGGLIVAYLNYSSVAARIIARDPRAAGNVMSPPIEYLFTSLLNNIDVLLFVGIVAFAVYSRFKVRI